MGRAVTFIGAADIPHCSDMVRFGGSTDVFVNGIGISREGDVNTVHLVPIPETKFCGIHARPITLGSTTVKVNGRGCGRVFDSITACTFVAQGSPNVFAGG